MEPVTAAKLLAFIKDSKFKNMTFAIVMLSTVFIITLVFIPISIISMIIAELNPFGEDLKKDIFYQTINEIKAEYAISNDLSTYIVKAADFTQNADLMTSKSDVYAFISEYFVISQEIEVEVETEVEVVTDGETTTVTETSTETITVYYFKTLTEIITMLLDEPFGFTDEDIRIIQALYFEASEETGGEPDTDITLKGKYPMPMSGYISSGYGDRIDPLNGKYFMHPALDIVGEHHAPVKAIADGTVVEINKTEGNIYGNTVTIRHEQNGDVFYSFSAHLSRIDVVQGQQIPQGQTIGLEGGDQSSDPNPGRTTGHHLHFEIWTGSTRASHVNPSLYLGE